MNYCVYVPKIGHEGPDEMDAFKKKRIFCKLYDATRTLYCKTLGLQGDTNSLLYNSDTWISTVHSAL